ncbi:MAG TPA: trypsin-like serine protease [Actinophytocola sp.]|uniref:S1 family peptidase n=1 Tax=Actinophytocola sp. TaxID=1872138 RepID=UPI002DDCB119|nr:trypsin-like serine protease [Actinophytocola sp.]HEV2782041.1 trypsin-like serine protease [Actinophytocola sp.]
MKTFRFALTIAGAVLALVGVVPAAHATPPPDPDPGVAPMIIGGGQATNAPWAARMFFNGQQRCSATIIAPRYILSARHCVGSPASAHTFRIGSLDQFAGGTMATGVAVFRHSTADLAIVQLDRSVSATYSPLGTTSNVAVGQTVQIYGWGATCTNQPEINCQSRTLKFANVRVTSVNARDAFGGIAVQATRIDGIAAGGDSGGPMFGSGRQVGVASTSNRSTVTNYTNITRYRSWIASVAGV